MKKIKKEQEEKRTRGSIFMNLPPGIKYNPVKPNKFNEKSPILKSPTIGSNPYV